MIRFTVTSAQTTVEDICNDWGVIRETATTILSEEGLKEVIPFTSSRRVPLGETKLRNSTFGTSLLLANSPMSPKIVNGSFAAIFDSNELFNDFTRKIQLREVDESSPGISVNILLGFA